MASGFEPIHPRHLHIHDHKIRLQGLSHIHRFTSAGGGAHVKPLMRQVVTEDGNKRHLVVH